MAFFDSISYCFLVQEGELNAFKKDAKQQALLEVEIEQLKLENQKFKERHATAENELFGARLAAKYLDKELAGRFVL